MIRAFIRSLFCQHEFQHVRGIYGDEIIEYGWKRSIWQCQKCAKIQYRHDLEGVIQ